MGGAASSSKVIFNSVYRNRGCTKGATQNHSINEIERSSTAGVLPPAHDVRVPHIVWRPMSPYPWLPLLLSAVSSEKASDRAKWPERRTAAAPLTRSTRALTSAASHETCGTFDATRYTGGGTRAAFVFSIFGSCSMRQQAQLLTAASILRTQGPQYPLAAMLAPHCWHNHTLRSILRREHVTPLCVPRIANITCYGSKQRGSYFDEHWTKLNLLNLVGLRVAVYLDSDMVVLRNIDHVISGLLSSPHLKEARTPQGCLDDRAGRIWFNTGFWGVKPIEMGFHRMLAWLREGKSHCYDGDQSAAAEYWRIQGRGGRKIDELMFLHAGYNIKADQGPERCLRKWSLNESDLHVVHFSGREKPYLELPRKDDLWLRAQRTFIRAFNGWEERLGVSLPVCTTEMQRRTDQGCSRRQRQR